MSEQGELDAERRRELERRAFARPRDEASAADAAAAAAELAALTPAATPPPLVRSADASGLRPEDDDLDDDRPWLATAGAAVLARLQGCMSLDDIERRGFVPLSSPRPYLFVDGDEFIIEWGPTGDARLIERPAPPSPGPVLDEPRSDEPGSDG